ERDRKAQEGHDRDQKARTHRAAAEGQVVAGVVEQVARAHARDRQGLRAPPAPYSSTVPAAPIASTGHSVSRPRESNSSVASTGRLGAEMPKKPRCCCGMFE